MHPAPSSSSIKHYDTVLFACIILPHRFDTILSIFPNLLSVGYPIIITSAYIYGGNIRIIHKGICFSRQLLFNAHPLAVYCLYECSPHVGQDSLCSRLRLSKL